MTVLEEVNEEALRILREAIEPCVFLFFEDFFAVNRDFNHPLQGILLGHADEATPHISIEGTELHRTIKLHGWSQIMQNVLGVRFQETFELPVGKLRGAEQLTVKGKIENGPGKRLLFEAFGSRTVNCSAQFPRDVFGSEIWAGEPVSFTFRPDAVSVNFYAEGPEELQAILSKLRSVRGEIAKRQDLSILKGDYAPFRAWAGIDPVTGETMNSATDKFNELFD